MSVRVTAVGDIFSALPWSRTVAARDPDLHSLLSSSDLAFANLEGTLLDLDTTSAYAEAEPGGNWLISPPSLAEELRDIGISTLSIANNHAMDFGERGLVESLEHLRRSGISVAGAGRDADAARAPRVEIVRGRSIALLAVTTTFPAHARAGAVAPRLGGRPGVNAIRMTESACVSRNDWNLLQKLTSSVEGWDRVVSSDVLKFGDRRFAVDEGLPSGQMRLDYTLHDRDVFNQLVAVTEASAMYDTVLVSVHSHEPSNGSDEPVSSLKSFARALIDAGAHAVIGHGAHQVRPVEVYRGRPIFYSLGSFVFNNSALPAIPADDFERLGLVPGEHLVSRILRARSAAYFDDVRFAQGAAVRLVLGSDGTVAEVTIVPTVLDTERASATFGIPSRAEGSHAEDILDRMLRDDAKKYLSNEDPRGSVTLDLT